MNWENVEKALFPPSRPFEEGSLLREPFNALPRWAHRLVAGMQNIYRVDRNARVTGLISIDDLAAYMNSDRLLATLVRIVSAA